MSSTNMTLRYNSEKENRLKSKMLMSCRDKDFCDFVIKVEAEEMRCHRLVLAASSSYFRSVLRSNNATEMDVDASISALTVKLVLDYLYGHEMNVSGVEQALAVLDVAKLWQLDDEILEQLDHYIASTAELTADNCLLVRDHLIRYKHRQQDVELVDQFICEHFRQVTCSDNFRRANLEYVLQLFDCDHLHVQDEKEVYDSALRWINADRENRKRHMSKVMMTVRMGLMNPVDMALISFDLTGSYSKELDHYIRSNIVYLKNNKSGVKGNVNMKSTTRRKSGIAKSGVKGNVNMKSTARMKSDIAKRMTEQSSVNTGTLMCLGGDDEHRLLKSVVTSVDNGRNWTPGPNMIEGRSYFNAAVCSGYVFVVGGLGLTRTSVGSCERFDVKSKIWEKIATLPAPRNEHSISCVDHQLYVTGGCVGGKGVTDTVLTLNLGYHLKDATGSWKVAKTMKNKRRAHGSCSLKGMLYVICGGWSPMGCERFDPNTNVWREMSPTRYRHSVVSACTDDTRYIYVAGDDDASVPTYVEVYDVTTDQWSVLLQPLSTSRCGLTLTYHGHSVFVLGGIDEDGIYRSDVEAFNLTTKKWAFISSLPGPRSYHATVSF